MLKYYSTFALYHPICHPLSLFLFDFKLILNAQQRKLLYKQIKYSYTSQLDNDEYEIVNRYELYGCKIATIYMGNTINSTFVPN